MNRVHIPKLEFEQIGEGVLGWYMDEIKVGPEHYAGDRRYPVFQPPCCHASAMTLHSIKSDGEVNASILCHCNKYHEFGIFDGWPSDLQKKAGSLTVEAV